VWGQFQANTIGQQAVGDAEIRYGFLILRGDFGRFRMIHGGEDWPAPASVEQMRIYSTGKLASPPCSAGHGN
jgi:hypothetical protein